MYPVLGAGGGNICSKEQFISFFNLFWFNHSVERLFHELVESGQEALYPVSLNENGILGLDPEVVAKQEISNLFILLKYYGYITALTVNLVFTCVQSGFS